MSAIVDALMAIGHTPPPRITRGWDHTGLARAEVFSYLRDFNALWGLPLASEDVISAAGMPGTGDSYGLRSVAMALLRSRQHRQVIVVWDGVPSLETGAVDLTRYLTPVDWAVALALEIEEIEATSVPDCTVWILDSGLSYDLGTGPAKLIESLSAGQIPLVPWLRICRVVERNCESKIEALVRVLQEPMNGAMPARTGSTAGTALREGKRLDPVRAIWTAGLTRQSPDASHHDIANLLGPQILLATSQSTAVAPLRELMRAMGLFPRREEIRPPVKITSIAGKAQPVAAGSAGNWLLDEGSGWIEWDTPVIEGGGLTWNQLLDRVAGKSVVSVLLIDDMWRHGWGEVLCCALGIAYRPEISDLRENGFVAIGSGEKLQVFATDRLNWLTKSLSDASDKRFLFRLDGIPGPQIGVLDLRLFGGNRLDEELMYFKSLLAIGRRMEERDHELPWPAVNREELDRIELWCDGGSVCEGKRTRNDIQYLEAITLLPRLIALTDPTFPVVVFSSTGRRVVIEKLKPYKNILTNFEKPQPLLFGSEELSAHMGNGFREVLRESLKLLLIREQCRRLPRAHTEQVLSHKSGAWTIEVLLDESGSTANQRGLPVEERKLTVGGLAVVYPPGQMSEVFNGALLEKAKGEFGVDLQNKDECRDNFPALVKLLEYESEINHVSIAAVSVTGTLANAVELDSEDELRNERLGDNLHRELTRCAIEGAIFQVARRLVPEGAASTLRVWLATRVVPLPDDPTLAKELATALRERWGVNTLWTGNGESLWAAEESIEKYKRYLEKNNQPLLKEVIDVLNSLRVAKAGIASRPRKKIAYLRGDSARPLVEGILQEYRGTEFRPAPKLSRAVGLNRVGGDALPLHYLADALLARPDCVPQWWKAGFRAEYGERLLRLLTAQRQTMSGAYSEGLSHGLDAAIESGGSQVTLEGRIAAALGEAIPKMNGIDVFSMRDHYFEAICEASRRLAPTRRLTGKISSIRPGICTIVAEGREYRAFNWPNYLNRGATVEFIRQRDQIPGGGNFVATNVRPMRRDASFRNER